MLAFLSSLCALLLCNHLPIIPAQSAANISGVLQDIIKVDARARPVKDINTVTEVEVSFNLLAIIQFDTVDQKLVSTGWLKVEWRNEYTTWDPRQYGNVERVSPDPDKVWRPRLTVLNTMKNLKPVGEDYVVMQLLYDGTTRWYPAERFETFCRVDVTYFPFDIQSCKWSLFVWGEPADEVDPVPFSSTIDLDNFNINGEWEVRGSKAWKESIEYDGASFGYVHYEVTLRRRPIVLSLTVLLPVLVLAVINVYVFTIPSESGERLAYSMTSLLSFGVFMSFILDSMPSSSLTLSIVAVSISCLLVMSAIYVLLCIMSLRLFHRDSSKHPVPSTVQNVIIWLEILVCLAPPAMNKISDLVPVQPAVDLTSTDFYGQHKDAKVKVSKLQDRLGKWAMTRKKNHAAYSDPSEMTWRRVSRTLDKLLFRFFLCLVIVSNVCVWTVMAINYNK